MPKPLTDAQAEAEVATLLDEALEGVPGVVRVGPKAAEAALTKIGDGLRAEVASTAGEAEREHLRLIVELNGMIRQERKALDFAEDREEEAKAKVKQLKAKLETLHKDLSDLIDNPYGSYPLLEPKAPKPSGENADDAWRSVPLGSLDLASGVVAALEEAGLETVGDLADWSAPPPQGQGKRLTDVKGIGEGKAEDVEQALERFWQARSEKAGIEWADAAIAADGTGEPDEEDGPADLDRELAEAVAEAEGMRAGLGVVNGEESRPRKRRGREGA